MTCRTIQPQLLDFSSGQLEGAAARTVAAHLDRCPECRQILQRERQTASLLSGLTPVRPRADGWPSIEAALNAESGWQKVEGRIPARRLSNGVRTVRPPLSVLHPFARIRLSRRHAPWFWAGGLTAAAALLFGLMMPVDRPAAPTLEPDALALFAPGTAAGLVQDHMGDPLGTMQSRMDRFLDRVAEHGS